MIGSCAFIALHVKIWKFFWLIKSPPSKRFLYLILIGLQGIAAWLCCFNYSEEDIDSLFNMIFLSFGWSIFVVNILKKILKISFYQ